MRKAILRILSIAAVIILVGCSQAIDPEQIEIKELSGEAEVQAPFSFTLNLKFIDETDQPFAAEAISCSFSNGTITENTVTGGSAVIEGFPAVTGVNCAVINRGDTTAEFSLSFWAGYAPAYYNNLNVVSVDMPGNISALYLTLQIHEDASVKCVSLSEESFDNAANDTDDFSGAVDESVAAATGLYGTRAVSEGGVKLREEPSTEGTVLRKMNFADVVMLMDQGQELEGMTWFKVKYEDYEGYISGDYLGRLFTINKNGVNIRKQPSAESESVYMVSSGTRIVGIDDGQMVGEEKWYRIITRGGISGYIRSDFLS